MDNTSWETQPQDSLTYLWPSSPGQCPNLRAYTEGEGQRSYVSRPAKTLPMTQWQEIHFCVIPREVTADDDGEYFSTTTGVLADIRQIGTCKGRSWTLTAFILQGFPAPLLTIVKPVLSPPPFKTHMTIHMPSCFH